MKTQRESNCKRTMNLIQLYKCYGENLNSTGGTSLSTTVFRISIHPGRVSLLIRSRGRLYYRDR